MSLGDDVAACLTALTGARFANSDDAVTSTGNVAGPEYQLLSRACQASGLLVMSKELRASSGGSRTIHVAPIRRLTDSIVGSLRRLADDEATRMQRLAESKAILERLTGLPTSLVASGKWLTIPDPVVHELPEKMSFLADLKGRGLIDYECWPQTPAVLAVYDVNANALKSMEDE